MAERHIVVGIDPSFTACGLSDGTRHDVIGSEPVDAERAKATAQRARYLADRVAAWIGEIPGTGGGAHLSVWIEAPMLSSLGGGAGHLYELGWLMNDLYRQILALVFCRVEIREVASATVRKFATGKGNTPKTAMGLAVYKRFGVEFERDPGCDKLFAYCLHRYGLAVADGEIEHVEAARRGAGSKTRAIVRAAAKARA